MDPSNYSQCVSQNYAKITKIMNTTIEKLNEIQKGKDNLGVSDFIVIFSGNYGTWCSDLLRIRLWAKRSRRTTIDARA